MTESGDGGDRGKTREQLMHELEQLRGENLQLHESEHKFRSLAESSPAQISIVQENRYLYANQAFLDYFEMDRDELQLITPEELMIGVMDRETIAHAIPGWQAAVARGETHFRFEFQDSEGSWFQSTVTMTRSGGKPSFIIMNIDITELRRAQAEMYRADKMAALGQIIAGVAHEINNPNNFITFNLPILRRYLEAVAELLEQRLGGEPAPTILNMPLEVFLEDVRKLLENMEHGSQRITSIVSDLKTYVRSDDSQERRVESVAQTVEHVMTLVGKQVRKMVKRFEVEVADGLPPVEMDPGRIEQVLINLLINAGQAADKPESWVRLSVQPAEGRDGWIALTVEDNGAGIPEDRMEKIFEPFFTSKGRDQGTGLGLSISHRIIEEHGGSITVDSTRGKGTRFTVLLPVAGTA